jgi:predicted DNA-binding antitoxin AbrB/MazE fold protein
MAMAIEATYENGAFVPAERPALAEHERVRLVVESIQAAANPDSQSRPDPFRNHNRTEIDPQLAREIASSPEFLPEES